MAELPLSKFAPFTKEDCRYKEEVSNKLKDLGVDCANCIYRGKDVSREEAANQMYFYTSEDHKDTKFFKCDILVEGQDIVSEFALCRFFTSSEEAEEAEGEEPTVDSEEELSVQIQKLDFTNASISESINQLREKLINEQH